MRYLGLALYAEGPSDYQFLPPVLHRLTDDLCLRRGQEIVEVGDILSLDTPSSCAEDDRGARILEAARAAWGAFSVLFIHTDGAGDPASASNERVQPAVALITSELGEDQARTVAIVPVRETEAWALADGEALRGAFGTTLADAELGVPGRPREVEGVFDPKQALAQAYFRVVGRQQRKRKAAHHLVAIAQRVRLEKLRQVPSFARFEDELTAALVHLGIVQREDR